MQFLDGISPLQLHQFVTVTGFHPADPEVGDEKADHMGFSQVRHKRSAIVVPLIPTDIAGGHMALITQALGKGLQAQHQIADQMAVLLGKAQEHGWSPGSMSTILQVFFRLPRLSGADGARLAIGSGRVAVRHGLRQAAAPELSHPPGSTNRRPGR